MKRFVCAIWVLICTLVMCATGRGAAMDDRVPQDALIYVGWQGSDALGPQYNASNLKGLIDASTIKDFINTRLPMLIKMAAAQDPTAPQAIAKLQTGLGIAWRHPSAFYLCPVDFANPNVPQFRFGLLCDAGNEAKALADLLKEALAKVPPQPELPINIVEDGTTVMMLFGKSQAAGELKQRGGLAAVPEYSKAMTSLQFRGTAALAMYIDVQKIMANVNDAMDKIPNMPPDVKSRVTHIIDVLGVGSLTQICSQAGFENKNWAERGFVGINGPRKGLLTLVDAPALSDGLLALVPKDAAAFSAMQLDLPRIYAEARTVAGQIEPSAPAMLDQGIAMANQQLGIDIEKDLLAPLGREWVYYRAPLVEDGGLSIGVVHKLKDGPTFAKALEAVEQQFNAKSGSPIKVEKVASGKSMVSAVLIPPSYSVAWTVHNDYLCISSLAGLSGVIAQIDKKGESIVDSDAYKAALAALPQGAKPTSLGYSNPARLYPELRQLALSLLPLAHAQGIDIPTDLLPDPSLVKPFMTPGAGMTWSDASGLHFASMSAFPGAEMMGGQQMSSGVAVGAMGMAVLLPSLGKARELSNRSVDQANIRGISQSCLVYAADHKDQLPDHLGRLILDGELSPKQLVSRRAGTQPLEMTPDLMQQGRADFAKFAQTVDEHCSFVYLGKGSSSQMDASLILVYERPGPGVADGISAGFADGHVEFIPWARVAQAFDATNAALKKQGQPVVDVQALLRASAMGGAPRAMPVNDLP